MKKLVWVLVVLVLAVVAVFALDPAHLRRDLVAMTRGADAVAYAEPRLVVKLEPGPPQPKVSPAEAGIDLVSIQAAVDYAAARNTRALVIGHNGHVVFEKYWDGSSLDTQVDLSGFTPALAALALGRAMYDDRRMRADDPLAHYLEEWRDDVRGTVTPRELMAGDSGFARETGWPWPGSRAARFAVRGDLAAALLDWPRDTALHAGQSPADVNASLLALALQRRLGVPYQDQIAQALWVPLGGGDFSMAHAGGDGGTGVVRAGCCLRARLGDWVRVGTLLANDGVFEGNQLMPPGFVKEMLSPTRKGSPSGWFTRVDGQFAARGVARLESPGKQRLWVVPSLRLVILRIGDEPSASAGWDETMIPDNIIRGTAGWQPTRPDEGVDPNKFAPH